MVIIRHRLDTHSCRINSSSHLLPISR